MKNEGLYRDKNHSNRSLEEKVDTNIYAADMCDYLAKHKKWKEQMLKQICSRKIFVKR